VIITLKLKSNKSIFWITAIIILAITYVSIFGAQIGSLKIPGSNDMRFGIDIRGGVEATYFPKDYDGIPSSEELESAKAVIEQRCDEKNILDRDITINKENGSILVRFPWKSDETEFNPEKAIDELGETALLTFRDAQGNILIEGKNVRKAYVQYDEQSRQQVVALEFDSEGDKLFAQATEKLIGSQMAIYMDDTMISNPMVNEKITGGKAIISGIENADEAKALAAKINSGSLPFSLRSKNYNAISPTMGTSALDVMVKAGIAAFAVICLFMIIKYRLPGFVAVFALLLQVACQLLALSIPQFTLTLPGIAAVILSIGMGVDANIITAERIKEEIADGKTVRSAIESGFHKAFSSVFDGNITVIIVAVILMIFGSGTMLSFGYSLLTGVILNFLCGVITSKLMIKSLSLYKCFATPKFYGNGKKCEKVIPFFKNRYKYYAISLVIFAVGVVCIFVNGIDFDIQFKGGAILNYSYSSEIDTSKAENIVEETLGRQCDIQTKSDLSSDSKKLSISLAGKEGLASEDQDRLTEALTEEFNNNNIKLSDVSVVEPFIGKSFAVDSIKAIVISSVLIILYVWFSFRKVSGLSAGVTGLIALLHDVLIVFFAFVIFKIPVNDSFIAAALTILGFSINDTIVIYDRVRENKLLYGTKMSIEEIVDKSITQSFTRSLNTNLCTLLSIVVVYIFATASDIQSIRTFALPMIFGIISGCYSTVCIAGPIWVSWQKHRSKAAADVSSVCSYKA
jgi:SecD/SecF fusion protein